MVQPESSSGSSSSLPPSSSPSSPASPVGSVRLEAEKNIHRYIESVTIGCDGDGDGDGAVPRRSEFHLPGWRWHYMSLIRASKRLQKLALREHCSVGVLFPPSEEDETTTDDGNCHHVSILKDAVDYVVGFNMKALHRIENELYFPVLRQKVQEIQNDDDTVRAFHVILDRWECKQRSIAELGSDLGKTLDTPLDEFSSESVRLASITSLRLASFIQRMGAFVKHLASLFDLHREMLIPIVAALVSEREQKTLTAKATLILGIMDSRIHFVGYYMAIADSKEEQQIWTKHIPSLPRSMIPYWKRSLYDARAGMLESVQ